MKCIVGTSSLKKLNSYFIKSIFLEDSCEISLQGMTWQMRHSS
jgi:hypothetical protein